MSKSAGLARNHQPRPSTWRSSPASTEPNTSRAWMSKLAGLSRSCVDEQVGGESPALTKHIPLRLVLRGHHLPGRATS